MAAKGRANSKYRHGLRTGYTEYRYGDSSLTPVRLAGPQRIEPTLRGEVRQHAVDRAIRVMKQWDQSPFQFEGSVRAGIRASLCMAGGSWGRSDRQAEEIVAEALRRIGAVRPTWEQGQRCYTDPVENCRWCGGEIAIEDRPSRFCSTEHARIALKVWGEKGQSMSESAKDAAFNSISRLRTKARTCEECDRKFKPQHESQSQRFCSRECVAASLRRYDPVPCRQCGEPFNPTPTAKGPTRFCSTACAYKAKSDVRIQKTCKCCGRGFVAKADHAAHCSLTCNSIMSRYRRGVPPKIVTPAVFDHSLYRVGARITEGRVTDALFEAA